LLIFNIFNPLTKINIPPKSEISIKKLSVIKFLNVFTRKNIVPWITNNGNAENDIIFPKVEAKKKAATPDSKELAIRRVLSLLRAL
jgi:hypothetical protein